MTNEIKEIIDNLKSKINYNDDDKLLMQIRLNGITLYEIKQLLDYITNLQEENKQIKDEYRKLSFDDAWEIAEYKSRNEKAIEYIVNNCDFKELIISDGNNDKIIKIKDLVNILGGDDNE